MLVTTSCVRALQYSSTPVMEFHRRGPPVPPAARLWRHSGVSQALSLLFPSSLFDVHSPLLVGPLPPWKPANELSHRGG